VVQNHVYKCVQRDFRNILDLLKKVNNDACLQI